jgi:hypothetical protein
MEGPNQVFALGNIDTDLSSDRAVDLREQGRGNMDNWNSPHEGRGSEPGYVPHHTPAERKYPGMTIGASLEQTIVNAGQGGPVLETLAVPNDNPVYPAERAFQ